MLLGSLLCLAAIATVQGELPEPANKASVRVKRQSNLLMSCALCNIIVRGLFQSFEQGLSNEEIVSAITATCTKLGGYSAKVCEGTTAAAMPTLRYIHNSTNIEAGNVCGILLQARKCAFSHPDKLEWTVKSSLVPKPPVITSIQPPQEGSPTMKVLHIADPHWDPEYLEGSNAKCGDPLCCRASSGTVKDPADSAGYWGDYRSCDMPWRTLESAVAHMAEHHNDAAYILWTGDLVPHDNWSTDKDESIMITKQLLSLVKEYFPNTPIYPTLGNHESHPVNAFAPSEITEEEFSTAWLYDQANELWAQWLPGDVSSTIRKGGYYTALVRPGLRIISINTNYCYTYNWWMLYSTHDPASGLFWLNHILEGAEKAGEKVHIMSHIPPGNSDCWSVFSREFVKIVERFESTVVAQFYGHTHNEEFKITYSADSSPLTNTSDDSNTTVITQRPINIAFMAGSLTTYADLNPSYRVYTIDGPRKNSSWAVLDFSTWAMNLTEANLIGPTEDPVWFKLYEAKEEYGLPDLSAKSVDDLVKRMVTDGDLFHSYYRNAHKASEPALAKDCDSKCRKNLLCRIVTADFKDQSHCERVSAALNPEEDK